jgi:hypothetical protein
VVKFAFREAVVNLGSQRPERVDHRLADIERLVKMAA